MNGIFGLMANALYTGHRGQAGGRGLSPRLWDRAYGQSLSPDGLANAYTAGDDFTNFGALTPSISGTTAYTAHGGYGAYLDTATSACSLKQIATAVGGVVQFATGATDNHELWLTSGGNSGVLGVISDTAGSDKRLIFEARVRFGQIANQNAFIGLGEEGLAAANTIDDSGDLASKDLIGFAVNEDDADALSFVYRKAGAALVTPIAIAQTLVANTWYKMGFIYDPDERPSQRLAIYVDNVVNATYVTKTNIEASTFPDGEELAFLAGLKNAAASALTMDIDWWAFHQAG